MSLYQLTILSSTSSSSLRLVHIAHLLLTLRCMTVMAIHDGIMPNVPPKLSKCSMHLQWEYAYLGNR